MLQRVDALEVLGPSASLQSAQRNTHSSSFLCKSFTSSVHNQALICLPPTEYY